MWRLQTTLRSIKLSATKSLRRSTKTEITASKWCRYASTNTLAKRPLRSRPRLKGVIHREHHLSAGKVRRFGGRSARCPRGRQRIARAPWPTAMAGATSDRISEILPGGGPRRALGRRTWRRNRWLWLQLDDGAVLVFVATLCQASNPGEGRRAGSSVENPNASAAQRSHQPGADHPRIQHHINGPLSEPRPLSARAALPHGGTGTVCRTEACRYRV